MMSKTMATQLLKIEIWSRISYILLYYPNLNIIVQLLPLPSESLWNQTILVKDKVAI